MFLYFVRLWYRLTMAWTRWRKPTAPVQPVDHILEIPGRVVYGDSWNADPRGVDFLAHPRCFQERLHRREDTYDCEDHAAYWAVVLLKSKLATSAGIGFTYWKTAEGKRVGHAVCVFEANDGKRYWADYGPPVLLERGTPWWLFGTHVVQQRPGSQMTKVAYVEITDVRGDDTPVFGGKHLTKGHWLRGTEW